MGFECTELTKDLIYAVNKVFYLEIYIGYVIYIYIIYSKDTILVKKRVGFITVGERVIDETGNTTSFSRMTYIGS